MNILHAGGAAGSVCKGDPAGLPVGGIIMTLQDKVVLVTGAAAASAARSVLAWRPREPGCGRGSN